MTNIEEAFDTIVDNFANQIEEDLKDEENMETPDQEIITQYKDAIDRITVFDKNKFIQHTMDYLSEDLGL